MLEEPYYLEYTCKVLEDMPRERAEIFRGPLRKYVIGTTQVRNISVIRFAFYQDRFLEAIEKWPWLLCRNLGEHLLSATHGSSVSYFEATHGGGPNWPY